MQYYYIHRARVTTSIATLPTSEYAYSMEGEDKDTPYGAKFSSSKIFAVFAN